MADNQNTGIVGDAVVWKNDVGSVVRATIGQDVNALSLQGGSLSERVLLRNIQDPQTAWDAATKEYVDALISAGVALASNSGLELVPPGNELRIRADHESIDVDSKTNELEVKDGGVTNAKLQHSEITLNAGDGVSITPAAAMQLGGVAEVKVNNSVVRAQVPGGATVPLNIAYYPSADGTQITPAQGVQIAQTGIMGPYNSLVLEGSSTAQQHLNISDARLKRDVRRLSGTGATETLRNLRPCSFKWKEPQGRDGLTHVGFLAQEVREVLPEAVHEIPGHANHHLSVEYNAIVSTLVAAVQLLEQRVRSLEKENNVPAS